MPILSHARRPGSIFAMLGWTAPLRPRMCQTVNVSQHSQGAPALRRCDEASGTDVKRLKDGALDHHRNDDKIDEGHLDFVGWPSVAD